MTLDRSPEDILREEQESRGSEMYTDEEIEQAQQEADHLRDVERGRQMVTEDPEPPKRCTCNSQSQDPDCHIDHTLSILEVGMAFPCEERRANVSTHNHPQTIRDNGLQDGCLRCRELADRPFSYLDDGNMESLIDRIADGAEPRSVNEDNAIRAVGRVMLQANTLWRLGWRPRS